MNGFNNNTYPKQTYFGNNPTNNIIWVQGIEGAKAWQLNPNSMAILLDSEIEGKMYIKVSDNIGMSSLRVFNYVEEIQQPTAVTRKEEIDLSEYVKKDELAAILKEAIAQYEQSMSVTNAAATTVANQAKSVKILPKQ